MRNVRSWKNFKDSLLRDKEVAKEYKRLAPKYNFISSIIEARLRRGLTQERLAQRVGTSQSAIARFESGESNPTFDFLDKVTSAVGVKIQVI